MATMPAFFRKAAGAVPAPAPRLIAVPHETDPFRLRSLPHEDVFFYCKDVDNRRLVREPDPQSRPACWSAIGAACVLLCALTTVAVPNVLGTLAGYRLESLRQEERKLLDERRSLELEEARLLNPANLEQLAKDHDLGVPAPGQIILLDSMSDSLAMAQQ
jgi:hypothetical protein